MSLVSAPRKDRTYVLARSPCAQDLVLLQRMQHMNIPRSSKYKSDRKAPFFQAN